jgi:2-oxoglutarate ferredoxin oxidoreductase subunit beta
MAFALSRLSHSPTGPTPLGILRNVEERGTYDDGVNAQLAEAKSKKGDGNIDDLIRSLGTWTVG